MGAEAGLAFAQRLGIDAMILLADDDGTVHEVMTGQFQAHFERMAEGR